MNHRRSDVRAAVFARQRSQGHLRAVTVTAGIAGVVTAGAVAAILPGSTHASASPQRGGQARARQPRDPRPAPPGTRHRPPARPGPPPGPPGIVTTTAGGRPGGRPGRYRTAAPVPTPAATVAPPQTTSGGS